MIDFGRAIQTAWERMIIILFQPFDIGKWGLIGLNAFLALLAEGGVSLNNPFPSGNQGTTRTTYTYNSTPEALRALKQFTTWASDIQNNPWVKIFLCFLAAYFVIWLVLTWVGCRAQFVLLDNIVRNRAALAEPWRRYARQGNVWYLFHLALSLLSVLAIGATGALFVFLNWAWINAARDPAGGEIATVIAGVLVFLLVTLVVGIIQFLIRAIVQPIYFKQTMGLGAALLAAMSLLLTRPLSIFVYLLLSFALALVAGVVVCLTVAVAFCASFSLICCVSCFPFVGSMLLSLLLCQLILPVIIFQRCFQLSVLEQFGPQYDVFRVDLPPTPTTGY